MANIQRPLLPILQIGLTALIMSINPPARAAGAADLVSIAARQAITANVISFSFRDQGRWEELRDLWTADGTISVSWYDGPIGGFIEKTKALAQAGAAITKHLISTPRITLCGQRALSETDVTIMVRTRSGPVEVDVTSYARFFDTLERSDDGVWRIHSRTAIYEKDRIDTVGPSVLFALIYPFLPLDKYPKELKHLAMGIERSGMPLASNIIVSASPQERQLKEAAWAWSGCTSP